MVNKMVEDIGKIISNGFETYTKNLNLSIPFILNAVITGIVAVILVIIGFFYFFSSSLASLKNAAGTEAVVSIILSIIRQHLFEIILLLVVIFLIVMFIAAFFTAGAIGMAKQATETGKSELSAMMEAGKKNLVNLYLAEILVGLISLAGIVFMVPGAMKVNISQLMSHENTGAILLLVAGFLLWILYLLIISIVLAMVSYALVVDNLDPVGGILTGFRFFTKNKLDVFLLWIITGIIAFVLGLIGQIMGLIPVLSIIWSFIDIFISIVIIPPIVTLWWVRLYMTRTDKKVYFNDLLAHPSDLERI